MAQRVDGAAGTERVVAGDPALRGQPQHLAAEVVADLGPVGVVRLAGDDVQHPVGPEGDVPAVVIAAAAPSSSMTGWIAPRRPPRGRAPRGSGLVPRVGLVEVDPGLVREVGVQGDAQQSPLGARAITSKVANGSSRARPSRTMQDLAQSPSRSRTCVPSGAKARFVRNSNPSANTSTSSTSCPAAGAAEAAIEHGRSARRASRRIPTSMPRRPVPVCLGARTGLASRRAGRRGVPRPHRRAQPVQPAPPRADRVDRPHLRRDVLRAGRARPAPGPDRARGST